MNIGGKAMETIYVKDIIKLFNVNVDVYYKGQWVMSSSELPYESDCWVMNERVKKIEISNIDDVAIMTG